MDQQEINDELRRILDESRRKKGIRIQDLLIWVNGQVNSPYTYTALIRQLNIGLPKAQALKKPNFRLLEDLAKIGFLWDSASGLHYMVDEILTIARGESLPRKADALKALKAFQQRNDNPVEVITDPLEQTIQRIERSLDPDQIQQLAVRLASRGQTAEIHLLSDLQIVRLRNLLYAWADQHGVEYTAIAASMNSDIVSKGVAPSTIPAILALDTGYGFMSAQLEAIALLLPVVLRWRGKIPVVGSRNFDSLQALLSSLASNATIELSQLMDNRQTG